MFVPGLTTKKGVHQGPSDGSIDARVEQISSNVRMSSSESLLNRFHTSTFGF